MIIELQIERVKEHMSLEGLRKIALLLIDAGADVNAKHTSPVKGYTPLMLAAELDEVNLVNAMLIKGATLGRHIIVKNYTKKWIAGT